MTPSQQVKLFCKQHQISVDSKHGVITLSKKHDAGAMWIECFDDYKEAYSFLCAAQNSYIIQAKKHPWHIANYK